MEQQNDRPSFTEEEALAFHAGDKPGKIAVVPSKPMATQRDLALAYSPGVAVPVRAIAERPEAVYDYTSKGNLVAVISNGTAILGLGDLGPLASKPVMEGKAVLFKRFADVDAIDIEVDTTDVEAFINCVRYLGPTFGGINLEDIKAPDCFVIEERLRELMDIPVFHDDQHGTAIICAAGIINALQLTGRKISEIKVVVNGAGAAGIACLELLKTMGLPSANAVLCDSKGVIYRGRTSGMNQWKSAHAVDTTARTLEEALVDCDVFLGLSVKGAVTKEMVKTMAKAPIIFAMANPDPEITPEEVKSVRSDAIVATGRSDYPNQVNNVLGFPYIFRGALDVRAREINLPMKVAAAEALAALAREDVPDEVATAYRGARPSYGPEYIIPSPFDPRLISRVSSAVSEAAIKSGVARRAIPDGERYRAELSARLDPSANLFHRLTTSVRANPKRVVFAEGEEPCVVRAAAAFQQAGLGKAILVGRREVVKATIKNAGLEEADLEIRVPHSAAEAAPYIEALYQRLQRRGALYRDCVRMVTNDRNIYAASLLAADEADAMVTGMTRAYAAALNDVRQVMDSPTGQRPMGVQILFAKGRVIFVADTSVHEHPTSEQLADIAVQSARVAKHFGYTPRVALLASSTFGYPRNERSERIVEAVNILDRRQVDFEYDGEMAVDVALSRDKLKLYPFCRLTDTANVLVMPAVHSADIATKLLQQVGGTSMLGPFLVGLEKPVQIVTLGAKMSEIYNAALVASL
ncbi:malate dehydrogenase (oxaloacetate-decarboxylating)(NADP+) [Rhizomicrobium palustre]|uniref:Malate dehydrogenase (Oxaloacetate-decarboxylating)(NADP+) n=1 Tax=Rhizomicrobium palustre TaxID=189966 RepID=A0A846MYV2_9PROT|nr:NADP-dependent malic enzyme [Rhizomicrobium palustre]NIK88271.1 malate dehydrogenase (oxaloacetate-decarboxylating)(NADP+) [Rhizomicrobium palustre]